MGASLVQSLLGAVRRRIWRATFIAAARWASWSSAGLLLLAAALHVTARPVHIDALALAIAALWASTMAWAASRRPSEPACALWADRHLGGASAYSTLLETRDGAQSAPQVEAVRWLEQWANASVPHALRLLDGRRDPARLVGPLVSLSVCAALAALVLTLPGVAPAARRNGAALAARAADRATPAQTAPLVSADLASELAGALRAADSRNARDREDAATTSSATAGKSDDHAGSTIADRHPVATPGGSGAVTRSLSGDAPDERHTADRATAASPGSGRGAGDSRDDRADAGVSGALPESMSIRQREPRALRPVTGRQADMDQPATFDEALTTPAAAKAPTEPAAPAATPPAAANAMRLTPTEAAYVQAWLKTDAKR